jgi:hypothetical protein
MMYPAMLKWNAIDGMLTLEIISFSFHGNKFQDQYPFQMYHYHYLDFSGYA